MAAVGFLQDIGGLGAHAEGAFGFLIGDLLTPGPGLGVQIVPGTESASRQEIALDIVKRALHPGAAVGIADRVGDESKPKICPKAAISGAITASAPLPEATTTLELSTMQRWALPSIKHSASRRKALASKRVKQG